MPEISRFFGIKLQQRGRVGVSPAGFGILPKQSSKVRDRETRSPAGDTPTLPETHKLPPLE
jgi:hypothetical protein